MSNIFDTEKLSGELIVVLGENGMAQLSPDKASGFIRDFTTAWASAHTTAAALAKLDTVVSPATARSLQATENVWRYIESRYNMLTSTEIAEALSAKGANRSYASHLRKTNRLLGVQRRNAYVFPDFQLDTVTGRVHDCIPALLALTEAAEWSAEELTIWLCTPSGLFGSDAPVKHIAETDRILAAATSATTVEW